MRESSTEQTVLNDGVFPQPLLVEFARAVVNPVRLGLLLLATAQEEITPRMAASELQIGLGRLSYHVRYLADLGALELKHTRPVRGAVQHVYGLSPSARTFMEAAIRGGLIDTASAQVQEARS